MLLYQSEEAVIVGNYLQVPVRQTLEDLLPGVKNDPRQHNGNLLVLGKTDNVKPRAEL